VLVTAIAVWRAARFAQTTADGDTYFIVSSRPYRWLALLPPLLLFVLWFTRRLLGRAALNKPGLKGAVREKLSLLRDKPYDELVTLPDCDTEDIRIEGHAALRSTYSKPLKANQIRVVVQVGTVTGSRVSQRYAEGFVVAPDGRRKEITAPEIYEFM
jgi:hypothetical protein